METVQNKIYPIFRLLTFTNYTLDGSIGYKPLPQRPARGPRLKRAESAGAAGERWFGDDANFEVPKDFPYKKLSESEELLELYPLTSKMLEDELQNIMIKIWQALPDKAPTEAEQAVADRLRNEAGDDMRNILGLNVTKRLLNTFNPLMVKVDFNEKPDGESFRSFLKWLGCVAMKRVPPGGAGGGGGQHTYVAQLRKIADFDRVCKRANVRIRELKAKITPCYNFTQCPPNLKTVYKEPEKKTNNQTAVELGSDAQKEKKTNKNEPLTYIKKTQTNEVKKTENESIAPMAQAVKPTEHEFKMPEVPKLFKTPTKVDHKTVANVAKMGQAKTAAQPVPKSLQVAKTQTKPTETAVSTNVKTVVTNAPPAKTVASKDTPKTESKLPEQKSNSNQNVSPKLVTSKTITKKAVPMTKPAVKKVAPTNITKKVKPRKESDFDVLDDEDILALMSNAIVLDECKGSDDEI